MSSKVSKLCVSLIPENYGQLQKWLPQCTGSDLLEIRIDLLKSPDFEKIRKLVDKPLIITPRTPSEGGRWPGSVRDYIKILQAACAAGVDYVDVEFPLAKLVFPQLDRGKTQIVLSHHSGEKTLDALTAIFDEMRARDADVFKLILEADSLKESAIALDLLGHAAQSGVQFVIHAMGENGLPSRLIGATRGNAWTYVAKDYDQETASGQPALHEARDFYFLHKKSPNTRTLGLAGWPIQQSKGWRLHNRLIDLKMSFAKSETTGSDYLYVNFPTENLDEFWANWQAHLHGLSVTIPHKEQMIKHLTEFSTEVRMSGVCNTVVATKTGWRGHNTDLLAMEQLLRPHQETIKNGGLIVGTGATARSAIAALKRLEVNPIFVVGRNDERGKMLSRKFGIDYLGFGEIHYASAVVIIQTTPVGMSPYVDEYPPGTALFRKNRVVLDVIYNPAETRFLKIAKERGCVAISGVEMFLAQAAKQFEIFTGKPVSIAEVRRVWEEIF